MDETHNKNKSRSYRSFVAAQTQWNPCLRNLSEFLHDSNSSQHTCHITSLEFPSASGLPSRQKVDPNSLPLMLRGTAKDRDNRCGRLLIVEDLSKDVVETLGSLLNIDPLFFASHIDTFKVDIATTRPSTVTLPSTMRSQNFLNVHYHRVIEFENLESKKVLLRDMNVPRKVKILPPLQGLTVGLARHCFSVLKTKGKDGLWLGKSSLIGRGDMITRKLICE